MGRVTILAIYFASPPLAFATGAACRRAAVQLVLVDAIILGPKVLMQGNIFSFSSSSLSVENVRRMG